MKHCVHHACKPDPGQDISCLCELQCMWGHCGCVARGSAICCLCGWSEWTDPKEIAERRAIEASALVAMGFSF